MNKTDAKAVITFIVMAVIITSFIIGIDVNEGDGNQPDIVIG
ncbi:hypothetical protein [Paenibacillus agricola]|nr:hypothetical protein [Paenibacillus agricola]